MQGWVDLVGLVTYLGGIPARRRSPIPALTGLNVEQIRSCDERRYHSAKLPVLREYVLSLATELEFCRWCLNCSFKSLLTPTSWNMRCSLDVYSKPHACCSDITTDTAHRQHTEHGKYFTRLTAPSLWKLHDSYSQTLRYVQYLSGTVDIQL